MNEYLVTELQTLHPNIKIPHVECGPGWFMLLNAILGEIDSVNGNRVPSRISIKQIKSKLGGLRFYYSFDNYDETNKQDTKDRDHLDGLIAGMEFMSHRICQQCGEFEEGKVRIKEWACKKCLAVYAVHDS